MEYIYRVYGWRLEGGIDMICKTPYKEQAIATGRNLNPKEYMHFLIIEHDIKRDSDFPIIAENLYRNKEYRKDRKW